MTVKKRKVFELFPKWLQRRCRCDVLRQDVQNLRGSDVVKARLPSADYCSSFGIGYVCVRHFGT